jgi:hypothetical protein
MGKKRRNKVKGIRSFEPNKISPQPNTLSKPKISKWIIPFLIIILIGFAIRFSNIKAQELQMLVGDDEYWHLHILNQMSNLGYRPQIDTQAWFPIGREMIHPPIFHYFTYLVYVFSGLSTFQTLFYIGPFIAIIAMVGWFLLCKELFKSNKAGLIAMMVYAVLPITVAPTVIGAARPQAFAEALMPFAFFLFLKSENVKYLNQRLLIILPGLLFALIGLTWEASLYLYLPLLLILGLLKKRAKSVITVLIIALSIDMLWYLPIYLKYGLWNETSNTLLQTTYTFWNPDLAFRLYAMLLANHFFLLIPIIAFPYLIYKFIKNRKDMNFISREFLTIAFLGFGLFAMLFLGQRFVGATIGFGLILFFASFGSRLSSDKLKALLVILLLSSAIFTGYMNSTEAIPCYEISGLSPLRNAFGNELPYNSTVVCWLGDASFLLAHGFNTPWDAYLEHLPSYAKEQSNKIARIYLSENEADAIAIMKDLQASYLLVRYELTFPDTFKTLLQLKGADNNLIQSDNPKSYYDFITIKKTIPIFAKDENGNILNPPIILGYKDVDVQDYLPTELGKNLLLSHLIWNEEAKPLKPITLSKPSMFELIWQSEDGYVLLYKVIE